MSISLPHDDCYWVAPGALLAGRMPARHDTESTLHLLTQIHRAGIRCYVNLQRDTERDELGEPFLPYWQLLSNLSPQPCYSRFGIPDMGVPSVHEMARILDHIDDRLADEKPVYVHCWGGKGRTGTVVCCWLIRHNFVSRDKVFEHLQRLREPARSKDAPSPETAAQRDFVLAWQSGM